MSNQEIIKSRSYLKVIFQPIYSDNYYSDNNTLTALI